MRNDLILDPLCIKGESELPNDDFSESIFFTGNGRMGVRGYLPFENEERGIAKGLYMAGIFGEIKPGITDLVNLPTPVYDKLLIDGNKAELCSKIKREYDLASGIVKFCFDLSAEGKAIRIAHERFFDITSPCIFAQRTTFSPLTKGSVNLTITSGISPFSCNCPIPDDQVKSNEETINLAILSNAKVDETSITAEYDIKGTGLKVSESVNFTLNRKFASKKAGDTLICFSLDLSEGESLTLDKITTVLSSRDVDPRIKKEEGVTYDELLSRHKAEFNRISKSYGAEVKITDPELLSALNYSMMQLTMNCSAGDPTVNIGARGISHGRYKGCYFWDTDIFMLPFYLKNNQEAAKNLCQYRVNMLPAAKEHSKKMNTAGARYPWMSSLDGSEQCETWDIGCSELHITADVVYAIDNYCKTVKDEDFYLSKAAEVYVETARFWASRYSWDKAGKKATLLFCKGPDEYCGITNNNLFTNIMVKHNLQLAIKAAKDLKEKETEKFESLGISDTETEGWNKLLNAIVIPRDPKTGHLTQDETFHLLEDVDVKQIKKSDEASYHSVCFDRLQRYKVIKQADVLLIMTRFPKAFTKEEKLQAWKDFEPVCLHDSTLSFASHALFALQNGLTKEGQKYLKKALLLDLRDIMNNTGHEGLHLANMGEAWSAAMAL